MAGIFGPTGREVFAKLQRERAQEAAARGAQVGGLSHTQQLGQAGAFLGLGLERGIQSLGGQVPPEVERANKLQAAQAAVQRSGVDANDPVAFNQALAQAFQEQGLLDEAREVGAEAERLSQERTESLNLESLIAARRDEKAQDRADELARDARAAEGLAGRESREETARLDRESRERIAAARVAKTGKPKVSRAATTSDRKQAGSVIRDTIDPGVWKDLTDTVTDGVSQADEMVSAVAQDARDLATANPGMTYAEALDIAVEQSKSGIGAPPGFFADIFGGGTTFDRPTAPAAGSAETDRARVDSILNL